MRTNRRSFLRSAATAAAAAPLAAMPALALASTDPDAELLALFRKVRELEDRACRAAADADELAHYQPLPDELQHVVYNPFSGAYGKTAMGREFIEDQIAKSAAYPERQAQWLAKRDMLDRLDAEQQAACEASGEAAKAREAEALFAEAGALDRRIVATPARGPLGLGVKIATWWYYGGSRHAAEFGDDAARATLMAALFDAERIAGCPLVSLTAEERAAFGRRADHG